MRRSLTLLLIISFSPRLIFVWKISEKTALKLGSVCQVVNKPDLDTQMHSANAMMWYMSGCGLSNVVMNVLNFKNRISIALSWQRRLS